MLLSGDKARRPKAETRKKPQKLKPETQQLPVRRPDLRISGFGLLSDLGFRPSDLCRTNDFHLCLEQSCPLRPYVRATVMLDGMPGSVTLDL